MPATISAGNWLIFSREILSGREFAAMEARLILANVLNQSTASILAHPEQEMNSEQRATANWLLERLVQGEPLPYLLGHWEFFGLNFMVRPGVLIPRPETELLVETALRWLRDHPHSRQAVDVGTGSGCIAGAMAVNVQDLDVIVVDISWGALEVAQQNFHQLDVIHRVHLVNADLLNGLCGQFDLVTANLPYIPGEKLVQLPALRYEPQLALDGGASGLEVIRRLVKDLPRVMAPGGIVLLEIENEQGQIALDLIKNELPQTQVNLFKDLAGLSRLVTVEF